ncbi:hypothetical protein [Streptomyces sp. 8N616]|uniref:hypothetical protein n=1 Tax=Streptomyces sp. 8N616 TaxID=3457414 RepID=UPI003FD574BB
MPVDFPSVIAASTRWLIRAYPAAGGTMNAVLAEAQARQAATVAAWLRYPTSVDAGLLSLVGPGGSARLDWVVGADTSDLEDEEYAWRTWVDEVVVSWAAALLVVPALAAAAVSALSGSEHAATPVDFRRLTSPGENDRRAAPLLRHPDFLRPVVELHKRELLVRLRSRPISTE